ncbi:MULTISPECIES: polysaccharide biosynthesis/export family protein [unclassified Rhizobium]|uniref:polysaccharide biosynthesis/export family protein n=1 Tax=unclassified Rhizobium TaxID=2613769 RepID=UPI000CF22623|nr:MULTISPECIES: polysaccharide biosynthesis/export family protein [Rhizobium]UWU23249.1 polysaccharide export protein [Rhizobium tropici]
MRVGAALLVCVVLAGCNSVSSEGPLAGAIDDDAGQSGVELGRKNAAVFDVVDINSRTARFVSDYVSSALNRRFGIGGPVGRVVIGVGDSLKVTIFEAGADGLFSTAQSKQVSLDIIVQPDGTAAIPYAGTVKFAGKTLEQARQAILAALATKAVEPDVIVTSTGTSSRTVTVSGAVGRPSMVPLDLIGEKITQVIAKAGGPVTQPYETYVTLVRGNRTGTVLLKSIIEHPTEDIYVQPGDQIFLVRDPRTFTLLGAVKGDGRLEFGANDLNLLEAVALGHGAVDEAANAQGFFLFRYEEPEIVQNLLGAARFQELVRKGMAPDSKGRYPIVYRFDMSHPDSLIVGQTFPVKSRDVIYVSRHPSVDIRKFLTLVGAPLNIASQGAATAANLGQ